jgi:hypothetical protein
MPHVIDRQEFDERHSKEGDCVNDGNGMHIYPDGARMDVSPHGFMFEPDPDPVRRRKVQLRFHTILLSRAKDDYAEAEGNIRNRAHHAVEEGRTPPSMQAVENLKPLRALVLKQQTRVDQLMDEIDTLSGAKAQREAEAKSTDANRQGGAAVLEELRKLRV